VATLTLLAQDIQVGGGGGGGFNNWKMSDRHPTPDANIREIYVVPKISYSNIGLDVITRWMPIPISDQTNLMSRSCTWTRTRTFKDSEVGCQISDISEKFNLFDSASSVWYRWSWNQAQSDIVHHILIDWVLTSYVKDYCTVFATI
jgi:hypothetical protein